MTFVLAHYWPYILAAAIAGVAVGWWGQAAARRRRGQGWEDEA
jgi:hypothetical protein